jgi:hypothetical protein
MGDYEDRKRRQREYQRAYRERKKAQRVADRDEIAREMLHAVITTMIDDGRERELVRVARVIVKRLAERGYDRDATWSVLSNIVRRYREGWTFHKRVALFEHDEA